MRSALLAWLILAVILLPPPGGAAPVSSKELVPFAEVQPALPEGSALVELRVDRPRGSFGSAHYTAQVLRRSGAVAGVDLGLAARIDRAAALLRAALADPMRDPAPSARALDALVMQPIRPLLGDITAVFLSPDGALAEVPFGALIDERGRYLVERITFTYLGRGRDLLRASASSPPRQGDMVFADPAFDVDTSPARVPPRSIDIGRARFPALPATLAEARAALRALSAAEIRTGADATEAAVKALHGPRILHIATHGFFLRGTAGLALAGANLRHSASEDGILTAEEASRLDLSGTKLVVLSGCETTLGLRDALSAAGAETQVTSLWKVDDEATAELMGAYYNALRGGQGRSLAMRAAQLAILARPDIAHPYYWASFFVSGNPAPIDEPSPARNGG